MLKIKVKKRLGKVYPYWYSNSKESSEWRFVRTYYILGLAIGIFIYKNE